MSSLPISNRLAQELDGLTPLTLDNDDIARAALIFANSRNEAGAADARCAEWRGRGRRIWREQPLAREALRQRTIARIRTRIAWRFLNQALAEWRPGDEGH